MAGSNCITSTRCRSNFCTTAGSVSTPNLGIGSGRADSRTGGAPGESVRDPYQDNTRTVVGGDHRSGDPANFDFGAGAISDWSPGSHYELKHPGVGSPLADGENLVVEPPRRLVQTMRTLWSEEAEREGTSRVSWEIEAVGDSCRLRVIHDQLSPTAPPELYGGWPMILSGLKTWLETGQTLTTPDSLMYGER